MGCLPAGRYGSNPRRGGGQPHLQDHRVYCGACFGRGVHPFIQSVVSAPGPDRRARAPFARCGAASVARPPEPRCALDHKLDDRRVAGGHRRRPYFGCSDPDGCGYHHQPLLWAAARDRGAGNLFGSDGAHGVAVGDRAEPISLCQRPERAWARCHPDLRRDVRRLWGDGHVDADACHRAAPSCGPTHRCKAVRTWWLERASYGLGARSRAACARCREDLKRRYHHRCGGAGRVGQSGLRRSHGAPSGRLQR